MGRMGQTGRQKGKKMKNFRQSDESGHQEAIIQWCQYRYGTYPELELLYHVPNGGKRDQKTAAALKRQGVKAGVPDLVLPVARGGFHGLYIELKAPGGNLQKNQREFMNKLQKQGYLAKKCVGWQETVELLSNYPDGKVQYGGFRSASVGINQDILLPAT